MVVAFLADFDEEKGIECRKCSMTTVEGDREVCAVLWARPYCALKGKLQECPLVPIENTCEKRSSNK